VTSSPIGRDQPETASAPTWTAKQRALIVAGTVVLVALLVGVVLAIVAMARNPQQTETIRDIFIILMAFESLLIGVALIVLIVQLARLIALLQNEVKPILDSTNETLNTLRGTTSFLSDNVARPVMKVSSSVSAFRRALDLIRFGRS
jgi:ABC-type spermidine/putrescine transport system permease subunit II